MKKIEFEFLDDNIAYFKNAIENTDLILQYLEDTEALSDIDNIISKWIPWQAYGEDYTYGIRKKVNAENINIINLKVLYIVDSIHSAMINVGKIYAEFKNLNESPNVSKNFVINKYDTGIEMGPHVDWNENNPNLQYSYVVYLNDNYKGGEIHFTNQDIIIKPEAGSIVLFPSTEPYQHRVLPIIEGNKYFIPHFWTKNGII